jgi:2-aminoadipate transaminase
VALFAMSHFWHRSAMAVKTLPNVELAAAPGRIGSSAIRDLLAVAERPDVISLAGGLPNPATFPVEALAEATAAVLADRTRGGLQYSATAGLEPLRAWVRPDAPDRVVVTNGSQQALELLARALVDPGDEIALADPAYVGALQAFRLAGARLIGAPSDGDGLRVDALADRLAAGARPRFVYVVADFDNPSGATLSLERRRALADLADRYGFLVVEDDPYGELRWAGERLPRIASLTDRAVTLGTVSKILAPGLRVGWGDMPPPLAATLVKLKQAVDLQPGTFSQRIAHHALTRPGFLPAHLALLRTTYEAQCRALSGALRAELGDRVVFHEPAGGMFLWARILGTEARPLLARAIDQGVAFVPGVEFAVDETAARPDALRLSFAPATPAELADAAARLRRAAA